MTIRTLSILIPCYNEELMIAGVLSALNKVTLDNSIQKEIIIVDDGSTDQTGELIRNFIATNASKDIQYLRHEKNRGKGACIQTALAKVTGEAVIVQDADMEYNPTECNKLLKPMTDGYADVVYGSRFRGSEAHRVLFFWHTIGNRFLTFLSNMLTGLNLTDMETGYKMFKTEIIKKVRLKEKKFGFEPEITARVSKLKNIRIYEVGISYYGRTYDEGKKIGWKDGFHALYCIIKYGVFK